jgi:hypothetical protein
MFKPRRDVAAPPGESGAPRIDMETARQRAREIASEATSTRGILPALPPPPERLSKESHALEKAVKPDCRTAYAGMGLLAVPVLVASSIASALTGQRPALTRAAKSQCPILSASRKRETMLYAATVATNSTNPRGSK